MLIWAIDGDDVGNKLRKFIVANDLKGVADFSQDLDAYLRYLSSWLKSKDLEIIFCGGDSILAISQQIDYQGILEEVPIKNHPFSMGIARTPEFAYLALQLAKARGKARAVYLEGSSAETVKLWKST